MASFCAAYLGTAPTSPPSEGAGEADESLRALLREVAVFLPLDHYYWALWAVNMASSAGCETFPYLAYSKRRCAQALQCSAPSL